MAKISFKKSVFLEDYGKPYIVAEVNTSHFGDLNIAKKMVKKAKTIGCDCIKFQSWSSESLYSNSYYKENPIAKRFVKKFSFSKEELLEISNYCRSIGIDFCSTPYSREEVDVLIDELNSHYIKVASMDLNNYSYLSYIASKNVPIVLSTGMAEIKEITKAISTIEKQGNLKICILHCVSIYPPKISTIQLKNILGLRKEFPNYPIGFSDHSVGTEIATASIALGACMVEKHLTLDNSKIGMDNQMAIEPNEMEQLVRNCHNVYSAMGQHRRKVSYEELEQRKIMRRSVITVKDLKKGAVLKEKDLEVKRPGTGISPEKLDSLIGKTINRDIEADTIINENDIS